MLKNEYVFTREEMIVLNRFFVYLTASAENQGFRNRDMSAIKRMLKKKGADSLPRFADGEVEDMIKSCFAGRKNMTNKELLDYARQYACG